MWEGFVVTICAIWMADSEEPGSSEDRSRGHKEAIQLEGTLKKKGRRRFGTVQGECSYDIVRLSTV